MMAKNRYDDATMKISVWQKDMAIIDVGLKMEGRVAMKEFGLGGKPSDLKVGDTVEVYLERVENALDRNLRDGLYRKPIHFASLRTFFARSVSFESVPF